ncbi:hypothetical protein FRC07_003406 [Ceratobasidium sp. 392]|nr:hypothetical protein FRC07_003406 [Ceratobasidium sp. 392]
MSLTTVTLETLQARRTQAEAEADKIWEKQDKQASDVVLMSSEDVERILTVTATVATLCGPPGEIVAGVFSTISSLIPVLEGSKQPELSLNDVKQVVSSISDQGRVQLRVDACDEFVEYTDVIPFLSKIVNGGPLVTAFNSLKDVVDWDDAKGRIAILNSVTCHLNAYALLCRIYAQLAQITRDEVAKESEYKSYKKSYSFHINAMKNVADDRIKKLNDWMDKLKKKRIDQWKEPVEKSDQVLQTSTEFFDLQYYQFKVCDEYTGSSKLFSYQIGPFDFFLKAEEKPYAKARALADACYSERRGLLEQHAERCLRNSRAIVATWNPIFEAAKQYLGPSMKTCSSTRDGKAVIEIKDTPHIVSWELYKPATWLSDAVQVAYAYKLSNDDGDSDMSNFTDWLGIEPALEGADSEMRRMPVIGLDDNQCLCKTKRIIFHKKKVKNGDDFKIEGEMEPYIQATVTEPVKGLYQFKDI